MNDSGNPILNQCSICFREEISNDDRCSTNCNHIFCKECLDQWFDLGKSSCPLCRQSIQYFTHQSIENRIINISTPENSRTVIPRSRYQALVITNARLKFSLFLSTVGLLSLSMLYMINMFDLNYYSTLLNNCENNNTLLNNQLNQFIYNEKHNYEQYL